MSNPDPKVSHTVDVSFAMDDAGDPSDSDDSVSAKAFEEAVRTIKRACAREHWSKKDLEPHGSTKMRQKNDHPSAR